jgi:hypothetical protein
MFQSHNYHNFIKIAEVTKLVLINSSTTTSANTHTHTHAHTHTLTHKHKNTHTHPHRSTHRVQSGIIIRLHTMAA